jgi:predicted N-acetyltransferase YhbS
MFEILQQQPADAPVIEDLMAEAFGPARYDRSVWALRPGAPVADLCLMGFVDGQPVGSLRFWEIMLGQQPILLLGPLAVRPEMRGRGFGQALVRSGLARAKASGWPLVLVSGEPDYYPKFGFVPAAGYQLDWPGFVEPERLQFCELVPGTLASLAPIGLAVRAIASPN